MKLNEVIKFVSINDSKIIKESIKDKSKSINLANNNYQKEWFLLKQEYQRKCIELSNWLKTEKNKIYVKHNLNLKKINLQ